MINPNYQDQNVYSASYPSAPDYPAYPNAAYAALPQLQLQLTHEIHSETLKLLAKAAEMSGQILGKSTNYSFVPPIAHPISVSAEPAIMPASLPNIHLDLSDRSWKMFNHEKHVHHHHEKNEDEEKKDDRGLRILVGLVGFVVTGVAAFYIGKTIAQEETVQDENLTVEDLKTRWNGNQFYYPQDYRKAVNCVIQRTNVLTQRDQTNRMHKVALIIFSFLSGGTAVAGALIGSKVVMGIAAGMAAAVACGALIKLGYAYYSTRDRKDAEVIDENLKMLSKQAVAVAN